MPIVMTKAEWAKIAKWADPFKDDPDTIRRREQLKFMEEKSREMTKNWPNSVENVNKRNEELRRARIEAAEQANTKFYKRYVKRKQEEQERMMFNARDTVFKNKDGPKFLLSAVIETVVQKERQEQLKFNNELRKMADDQKKQDDDDIIRRAKEWHELQALRKKRRFEVNKQHQKELSEQAKEVEERNRKEYESEVNYQKVDNMRADEEMDAIRKFEEEFKEAEKKRILSEMSRARCEAAARRGEREARSRLEARLQEVVERARARVHSRRRHTEQQMKKDRLAVLENISKQLRSGDAAREAKEQAIFQKALNEKEAAMNARRVAEERKRASSKRERIDVHKQFLEEEARRRRQRDTVRHWELINRFKNVELYQDFQEKLREEKLRKTLQYREDILKQWKEREDRETAERAARLKFYGEDAERGLRDADNRLLTYADQLLREAEQHGRPTLPLHRAIDRYCKQYRLYPMPALAASQQRVFPRYLPQDRSRPAPGYRAPRPPAHRDGLRADEPGVPVPAEAKEKDADYVRSGPANGLQRKDEI